jgi:hypothetical protein
VEKSESGGRLLVVTGVPGAGKSVLLHELNRRGWRTLVGDDAATWADRDHQAWDRFIEGNSAPLLEISFEEGRGLAVEWGFPGQFIDVVEGWLASGCDVWFLDGDREAAFIAWRQVNPGDSGESFRRQIASLDAVHKRIRNAFGSRRLDVVSPGPKHVPVEEMLRLMGID